jgi:hypothetical protein
MCRSRPNGTPFSPVELTSLVEMGNEAAEMVFADRLKTLQEA